MQHKIIIIICGLIAYTLTLSALEINNRTEYSYDHDRENTTHHFFRERSTYTLGSQQIFLGFVNARTEDTASATYCLRLYATPFMILLGHYYIHIGSGLALALQSSFSSTPFINYTDPDNVKRYPFRPCTSGNPDDAFRGVAVSYTLVEKRPFLVLLHAFYSHSYAFMDEDACEAQSTDNSLATLMQKDRPAGKDTTPLSCITAGKICTVRLQPYVIFQFYGFKIWNRSINGKKIGWQVRDTSYATGVYEYGCFTAYKDRYLHLFYEHAFSAINARSLKDSRTIYDHAVHTGFKFSHYFLTLSCIRSYLHTHYYAPFCNPTGNNTPFSGLYAACTIKPSTSLRVITKLSLGKKHVTHLHNQEPLYRKQHQYEIEAKPLPATRLTYRYTSTRYTQDTITRIRQHKAGIYIAFTKKNTMTATCLLQDRTDYNKSLLYTCSQSCTLYESHTLYAGYAYASISAHNTVYSALGVQPGTSMTGSYISDSASLYTAKYCYKKNNMSIHMRILLRYHGREWAFSRYDLAAHVKL